MVSHDQILERKVSAGTTAINKDAKQYPEEAQHRRGSNIRAGHATVCMLLIDFCRPSTCPVRFKI